MLPIPDKTAAAAASKLISLALTVKNSSQLTSSPSSSVVFDGSLQ